MLRFIGSLLVLLAVLLTVDHFWMDGKISAYLPMKEFRAMKNLLIQRVEGWGDAFING